MLLGLGYRLQLTRPTCGGGRTRWSNMPGLSAASGRRVSTLTARVAKIFCPTCQKALTSQQISDASWECDVCSVALGGTSTIKVGAGG